MGRQRQIGSPTAEILVGGLEVIDRSAAEWRALCASTPYAQPFYQPEWICSYVSAFAPRSTVVLITVRSDGKLTAVLPLVRQIALHGGLIARELRAAGNTHTCRYDLIHDPRERSTCVAAIWDALNGMPGWDVLALDNVPARGAVADLMRRAQIGRCAVRALRGLRPPYVPLPSAEQGIGGLLARLDAKFRGNLRRRTRKLSQRGALDLVCSNGPGAALDTFYALEMAGWKGREGSAIACDPSTRRFYDSVADAGEQVGELALYALTCNGKPVAMHYALRDGKRYYLLKTAFDEAHADCSPGQIITHEVMRELIARGYLEFDFLGGLMPWKRDWAPRLRPHASWYAYRGPVGRVVYAIHTQVRKPIGRAARRLRTLAAGVRGGAEDDAGSPHRLHA